MTEKDKNSVVEKLREEGFDTARTNTLCEGCVKYAKVNKLAISLNLTSSLISFYPYLVSQSSFSN